jgi:hypothetical protein
MEEVKAYDHGYAEGYENAIKDMYKTALFINIDDSAWKELRRLFKKLIELVEERKEHEI